jgi:shikimate dehydrogenase
MISGKTSIYGLFGYPVEHSFSPGMHNAAFAKLGMDACYVPFAVHPDRLEAAVRSIPALNLRGMNVTVPHKQAVMSWLHDLSEEARLIGAVNTIEVNGDRLTGHNTDGRGFLRSLKEDAAFNPKGKRVLFIGSGGAARAVGFSLALSGARSILFMDLDQKKASALSEDIRQKTGADVQAIGHELLSEAAAGADCLINATPLGLKKSDPIPLSKEFIQKKHLVCDLVYNPPETPFLKAAKDRHAKRLSGIGMLLYQGVIAFEVWTGKKAPVSVMKNALSRQIRAKG